jgi:protein phosphatase inhibitor 2
MSRVGQAQYFLSNHRAHLCNLFYMKSILKRPNDSDPEHRGIRWDEENIRVTEEQKDSTMKVTEPKTPYIHYDHENDFAFTAGIAPFELEQAMANIKTSSQSSVFSETDKSERSVEWETDEDEKLDPGSMNLLESIEKHRKFAKLRSQHYNMKQVLKHTKELLEHEEEDEHFNDPDYHDVPDDEENIDEEKEEDE